MFRTLALRHLVVVDGRNRVLGIIERTDLLPFNIRERLEKLLADPKDANIGADDSKTIVVDYSVEDGNDEDGAKISRGWSMSRYVAPSTEGATENTSVIHEAWTTPVEIHTVETTSSHSRIKLDADEGSIDDDDDDDDHHTDSGCSNTRM